MNINDFRKFVLFLANKAQAGIYITPEEFNLAAKQGYIEWVMSKYGNDKEYLVGQEIPRIAWQKTQKITDDLSYLLESRTFNVGADGKLKLPDGSSVKDNSSQIAPEYMHLSSVRSRLIKVVDGVVDIKEKFVDILRDNEISHVLNSQIVTPSLKYPVGAFYKDFIQFYPKDIKSVVLTYLRKPTAPVWGSTIVNNRATYNPATSVDLEAPDQAVNDIAIRVLRFLGIHVRDQELQSYAQVMKNEGI